MPVERPQKTQLRLEQLQKNPVPTQRGENCFDKLPKRALCWQWPGEKSPACSPGCSASLGGRISPPCPHPLPPPNPLHTNFLAAISDRQLANNRLFLFGPHKGPPPLLTARSNDQRQPRRPSTPSQTGHNIAHNATRVS